MLLHNSNLSDTESHSVMKKPSNNLHILFLFVEILVLRPSDKQVFTGSQMSGKWRDTL